MKEYTVTYSIDITEIFNADDDMEMTVTDEDFIAFLEDKLKIRNAFDDVRVRNFKVFVRDLEDNINE